MTGPPPPPDHFHISFGVFMVVCMSVLTAGLFLGYWVGSLKNLSEVDHLSD